MDNEASRNDELENILQDGSSEPRSLPLDYLRKITNNFSNGQLLGVGGFGKVYKGVCQNGKCIAVKKLDQLKATVQKPQFENEVYHLMRLKHPNIVRFVGYCYETRNECVFHDGKYVFAEMPQKLVCLEYLPNGSLDRHVSDESSGLGWYTRHKIIRGTCFGLHYLHEECKSQFNASIIHLDLKPANILLDDNMVPKIADFGLSKLFDTGKTQTRTTSPAGSLGYMAPEYIYQHTVSTKADIYSLGAIIIEVITGCMFGPSGMETLFCTDFVEPVLRNWRNRLEATPTCRSPETDCQQIEICLEIGLSCTNFDPGKRPTTTKIIEMLNRCESTNCDEERLAANQDNLGDMTQPGNIYNPNHQQVTLSRNEPSPSYNNMDSNRNALQQYAQGPSDRHIEQMYHGSNFQQDTGGTAPSNYFEGEGRVDGDSQLYQPDGDALPGIEGFQIAGEPRPGFKLIACGFPTNGTTLCNFQWVRHLENGIRRSIEGATMYEYVVTADDVGTLLAVDCTPMDDNGRQGDLVTEFANNGNKITCDPEMQSSIDAYVSTDRAEFEVYVLAYSPEEWELATLVLTRPNYQIKFTKTGEVIIDEKYSQSLQMKIPNGRTTQFVLVTAGATLPFNTHGVSENEDYNVRLRDLIVFVMRTFQKKALDVKRKGMA